MVTLSMSEEEFAALPELLAFARVSAASHAQHLERIQQAPNAARVCWEAAQLAESLRARIAGVTPVSLQRDTPRDVQVAAPLTQLLTRQRHMCVCGHMRARHTRTETVKHACSDCSCHTYRQDPTA